MQFPQENLQNSFDLGLCCFLTTPGFQSFHVIRLRLITLFTCVQDIMPK